MANKRGWVHIQEKAAKKKVTDEIKEKITNFFNPLVEEYREQIKNIVPNKEYPYAIEVYTKWVQSYFYFGCVLKLDFENRIADKVDDKFARLEFVDNNLFNIAYKRHTGSWFQIATNLSLEEALVCLRNDPMLQPMF